ncbi:MAG: NADP-dependent malic enzyme, partial [Candidatus Pacebacteria bacterium]|nr:NADP-dependent malic enzyme [Candidatus Paceibacterota bacterium]
MTNTNQINKDSLELHKKYRGKFEIKSLMPVNNNKELAVAYTPGVGAVCTAIADGSVKSSDVVTSKNTVAIITDGSAVLGLGNIGSEAGLPVMEGKAILLKEFAGIDAFPIALATQDTEEIVQTIKNIAPTFGAINLEDISAPRCFEIEQRLMSELDMPVFHDDQHGTAIVVLAGLINALKIVSKYKEEVSVVVNGAGAAGHSLVELLTAYGFKVLTVLDSRGVLNEQEVCSSESTKGHFCEVIKETCANGDAGRCNQESLAEAVSGADVFIGVSAPNILNEEMVSTMQSDAIVFALANPNPEILPSEALAGGAKVVATGRSDFPNQINNALVFPGLFKGLFASGATKVTMPMKVAIAEALAGLVPEPTPEKI